jgi:hypothetical protein
MSWFALLLGHLVGDYLWQNDWMARNKTNPHPGPEPCPGRVRSSSGLTTQPRDYPGLWTVNADPANREGFALAMAERNRRVDDWDRQERERVAAALVPAEQRAWWAAEKAYRLGHLACLVHCVLYTLAVWLFSFWWLPWWGLLTVFALHYPVDRWRLARVWMERLSGQREFANGPFAPWSVVVVDNVFHLLVLWLVGCLAGAPA